MSVHLFLSCEGWVRFGPFKWHEFFDQERTIVDDEGHIVASSNGQHWTASDPEYTGYFFSNPFVTTTKRHPHPYSMTKPEIYPKTAVEGEQE